MKKYGDFLKNKLQLNSATFIVMVSCYFAIMLNLKFWRFMLGSLQIDSFSSVFFALSLPIVMFIILFWFFNLITLPYVGKPLIILLLVLSAVSDYALQNFGVYINLDMIRNIAETNMREATDLITVPFILYTLIIGVFPAVGICFIKINYNSFGKELKSRLWRVLCGVLAIGIIAPVSYKSCVSFGRNHTQMRYYINTFNYIYATIRYYKENLDAGREFVILDKAPRTIPDGDDKPRVTVLIVGETARAANFSLYGYDRETNPLLHKNKDIITFGNVSSCGTSTAVSLPCMFSSLPRKKFDVTDARYTQNLLDIAQAAGYDIFWIDNDDGCKKVCDRVNKEDAKKKNKEPYCFGSYCHDDILLEYLEDRLGKIKKDTLIVLHTMGSHGPTYYKRYPEKFKRFTPTCDTADIQKCTREEIINTYNNTIVYTDYIIASAIEILSKHHEQQNALLYVSDHGESLGENNIYLHGLPYVMAPDEQKKVPMVLWMARDTQKSMGIDETCLRNAAQTQKFSHDNYFHSVLRLLAVKTSAYDAGLDMLNKCIRQPATELVDVRTPSAAGTSSSRKVGLPLH